MSKELTPDEVGTLFNEIAEKSSNEVVDKEDLKFAICLDDFCGLEKPEGFEFIYQEGGGEGGSEHCETVFKWDGQHYKVHFDYYSHHGFEFDYLSIYKVEPKPINTVVYE